MADTNKALDAKAPNAKPVDTQAADALATALHNTSDSSEPDQGDSGKKNAEPLAYEHARREIERKLNAKSQVLPVTLPEHVQWFKDNDYDPDQPFRDAIEANQRAVGKAPQDDLVALLAELEATPQATGATTTTGTPASVSTQSGARGLRSSASPVSGGKEKK